MQISEIMIESAVKIIQVWQPCSYWINFTSILRVMLTSILRIGPLVILEGILLSLAIVIQLLTTLPPCYIYTLSELAIIIFLIETFTALRIIKRTAPLRNTYVRRRVQRGKFIFYAQLIWDHLNLVLVLMLLYSSLVEDGIRLATPVYTANYPSNDCHYSLFSICVFSQFFRECSYGAEDGMIVWTLYAITAFLVTLLSVLVSKQYYHYCSSLSKNRRILRNRGSISETLIDAHSCEATQLQCQNQALRDQIGDCPICLNPLLQSQGSPQKLLQLHCHHSFHQNCLQDWLKVKDHCPFRCRPYQ